MDINQIRQLLKEHATVVLVEQGQPPLIVKELRTSEAPQEVPIAARWPKARPPVSVTQDSVLERLNQEIVALKEQIAQEEAQTEVQGN